MANWPLISPASGITAFITARVHKFCCVLTAAGALADIKLLPKADRKTLNEIERTLIRHFTELMHKRPKMAKYITIR